MIRNKAKCLLDAVETCLSLLDRHNLCFFGLHNVVKLELSRIFSNVLLQESSDVTKGL